MSKSKQKVRMIHNLENETTLKSWYEDNGFNVKLTTKKSTAKNGAIISIRQIVVE